MKLTQSNYHSAAASKIWLSSSDIKRAHRCETDFLYGKRDENKPAFTAGHLFEMLVTDDKRGLNKLYKEHPEMFYSRGANAGELKAEYQNIVDCANRVRSQSFLMDIIRPARKQVILTGRILGVPVRMMCDLLTSTGDIFDLKTARDFKMIYDCDTGLYVEWWQYWGYPMQLWIYREIARQNGLDPQRVGIIGVSKLNCDVQAIQFSDEILSMAKADTLYTINRIKALKNGETPNRCEHCDSCISTRQITDFCIV